MRVPYQDVRAGQAVPAVGPDARSVMERRGVGMPEPKCRKGD